jgi:hypothetical protein
MITFYLLILKISFFQNIFILQKSLPKSSLDRIKAVIQISDKNLFSEIESVLILLSIASKIIYFSIQNGQQYQGKTDQIGLGCQ